MKKINIYSRPESEVVVVWLEAAVLSETKGNNSTEDYEVENVNPFSA